MLSLISVWLYFHIQDENSDLDASDELTEENEDANDTAENNEALTIDSSVTDDKPCIVAQDTGVIVPQDTFAVVRQDDKSSLVPQDTTLESGVDPVVQGSDAELVVNNSNKEEIKTESS